MPTATVIGYNKSRDLFQPITVAVCKNKLRLNCILKWSTVSTMVLHPLQRVYTLYRELWDDWKQKIKNRTITPAPIQRLPNSCIFIRFCSVHHECLSDWNSCSIVYFQSPFTYMFGITYFMWSIWPFTVLLYWCSKFHKNYIKIQKNIT